MDSLKSIVVVAILLGVLYGIYQVINDENSPISTASTSPNILDGLDTASENGANPASPDESGELGAKNSSDADSSMIANQKTPPSISKPRSFAPGQFSSPTMGNTNEESQNPGSSGFMYPEKKEQKPNSSNGRLLVNSEDGQPASSFAPDSKSFDSGTLDTGSPDPTFDSPKMTAKFASTPIQDSSVEQASAPMSSAPSSGSTFGSENVSTPDQGNKFGGSDQRSGSPRFATNDKLTANAPASNGTPFIREIFPKDSYSDFSVKLVSDVTEARDIIENQDDFEGALRLLTKYYDHSLLIPEEHTNLLSYLDPLAGKVIYSTEHHLVEKHFVRQNETLKSLSEKYKIPSELILNINRLSIANPNSLTPGTELKLVEGPFHVEISLSKKRLALFVQGLYAGNFPVRIGIEQPPKPGIYRVKTKSRLGKAYRDRNNQLIDARDPNNPYGDYHLDLGQNIAIHGSAQVSDSNDLRGSISLNSIDAEDVHNILTTDSIVKIVE